MKIVMETKNKTAALSGSINTPTRNHSAPVGSQLTADLNGCSPKCSTPRARAKTIMLAIHERIAAPTPMVWLNALFLFVNSTIRKNASAGGSGINQINASVVIKPPRDDHSVLDTSIFDNSIFDIRYSIFEYRVSSIEYRIPSYHFIKSISSATTVLRRR